MKVLVSAALPTLSVNQNHTLTGELRQNLINLGLGFEGCIYITETGQTVVGFISDWDDALEDIYTTVNQKFEHMERSVEGGKVIWRGLNYELV